MLVVILLARFRAQLSYSREMHRYSEEEGSSTMTSTKLFSVDLHNAMVGQCHASYPPLKDSFIAGIVLVTMIVRAI